MLVNIENKKQKSYKANANISQQDSSGSIPSIEITKENLEGADYISDESEYQEGENNNSNNNNTNNGRMGRRHSTVPPSPLPSSSSYAQHHQQSPQHQYHQQHQPQVNISCVAMNEKKSVDC